MLEQHYKQELELFVFYFSNQTLCLEESSKHHTDYRTIVEKHPILFEIITHEFIKALENNSYSKKLKKEIVKLIYNFDPQKREKLNTASDHNKKDIYAVARKFFSAIASLETEVDKKAFQLLLSSPNDIQMLFRIWGNNIIVDTLGNVTNESYCLERGKAFIQYLVEGKEPLNEFLPFELEANT